MTFLQARYSAAMADAVETVRAIYDAVARGDGATVFARGGRVVQVRWFASREDALAAAEARS